MVEINRNPFSVVYFPFTYIKGNFLKSILLFFDDLTILQPSEWRTATPFGELVKAGYLHYETPSPAGSELSALKRTVNEILSWGDVAFSAGQLENIKHFDKPSAGGEGSEMLSALRGTDKQKPDDRAAAARIFLHLAQEHDQKQDEIESISSRVNHDEERLWSELMIDKEEAEMLAPAPLPATDEAVAVSARLAAWSQLFADKIPASQVLLTTDPAVMDLLPPHELLISFPLPNLDIKSFEDVLLFCKSPELNESAGTLKIELAGLMRNISEKEGTPLQEHLGTAKRLSSSRAMSNFQKLVIKDDRYAPYELSLYVFPDNSISGLFRSVPEKGKAFAFLLGKT